MRINTYRKKPITISAVQLTKENIHNVLYWIREFEQEVRYASEPPMRAVVGLVIHTLEGDMVARYGDWIIKGVKDEFYPCKPDIFEATYELDDNPTGGSNGS